MGMTKGGNRRQEEQTKVLEQENNALKAALTLPTASETGPEDDEMKELRKLLLQQVKNAAEEKQAAEERQKERQLKSLKEQGDRAEQLKRAAEAFQASCSHTIRGEARTGGQWNSDGHYNIICLHCNKTFTDKPGGTPCPPNLWPTDDIGGAVMESVNRIGKPEAVSAS